MQKLYALNYYCTKRTFMEVFRAHSSGYVLAENHEQARQFALEIAERNHPGWDDYQVGAILIPDDVVLEAASQIKSPEKAVSKRFGFGDIIKGYESQDPIIQ